MSIRSTVLKKIKGFEKPFATYNNISISRAAILHNFDIMKALSPTGMVIPVLKANAYGHGLEEVTTILKARSFPYLAVDGYFEGLRIHDVSSQPVLIMGAINPDNFKRMRFKGFAFVVHDKQTIQALDATKKPVKVHLEIETGMSRHGIGIKELPTYLDLLKACQRLEVEGVMTHLADADNPNSKDHVELQVKRFDKAMRNILASGFSPRYIHISQSAGSVKAKSGYANTIRIGIALYGITPLAAADPFRHKLASLRPALTLTSTIAKVIEIEPGESVSYGRTFKARRQSQIGILPLGYYEGVPRALSNTGEVQWHNSYLPIVGRVCMNHTIIDLTDSKAKEGDVITIISPDKRYRISLESICLKHNLFNYSLIAGLNQNIRRTVS